MQETLLRQPAIQSREYQDRLLHGVASGVIKDKRIIGYMATGGGKTVVFIRLSKGAIDKGRTVLIITESTKIFPQISKKIDRCIEISAGVRDAVVVQGAVHVAMTQTLSKRPELITRFASLGESLIVIADEAHIGTHTKLLKQLMGCLIVGFTASPDYRVAKHLPVIYKDIVMGPQPHQLVQDGFLSPYRHFERKAIDAKGLQVKGGEFTEASQESVFETRRVYDGLVEDLKNTPFTKGLIFCSSIKHCTKLYEELKSQGFDCVMVHSQLPSADEKYNMGQFTYGTVKLCISVGVLTKGYDFPAIDLVGLMRATMSLALYLQMIGRGSRIFPGKSHFTVLDYGLNATRHLPWDWDHPWQDMWCAPAKKKKGGVQPIKVCPKCDYIMPAPVMKCPNCGHEFIKPKEKDVQTQLVEVNQRYRGLVGKRISELTPEELAVYAKSKNRAFLCMRVSQANERLKPGFVSKFGKAMGYAYGWVSRTMERMPHPDQPIDYQDFILK